MLIARLILIPLLATSFLLQVTNAEVYRWKDKNGNIHFSDKPHADSTQLDIKAPQPSGIGISKKQTQRTKELLEQFQEKNNSNKKQALKSKKRRDSLDRYCTQLKNRLRNYQEVDYLFTRSKSGEKRDLSDKKKRQEEEKLRAEIAEKC